MVITGTQIITRALQGIRVLGVGRSLTDRDATMALVYLQELIDSWKADNRTIYTVTRSPFTLVASAQTRTIGPSAQFAVTPRPIFLASAMVIPVGDTVEQPVDIWTRQDWLYERDKALTDLYPRAVFMEPGAATNTLNFWPIPTTAATLYLGIPTGIVAFVDLTTQYTFPEGYHEALRTELEIRLAPIFGKPVTATMEKAAVVALNRISDMNSQGPPPYESDGALSPAGGHYDGDLGDYR